ncbi:hypothetical protein K458DRAFT_393092 [Lentithecium fluviatile CBS 122367]|uniref:Uncharacterized protein n=1 Tax=Lentithecium fluviatile CBS 122367 TaxID=1168545 RepID=A0A6G1IPU2_9PLEO|nr:hypothetical protein K458DRAFT_393092 [Lentithecium fluviatile CBS 122367]
MFQRSNPHTSSELRTHFTRLSGFRLTSRRFLALNEPTFIDAVIAVLLIDITTAGLQALKTILSREKGYGRHVRKVGIERKQLSVKHYNDLKQGRLEACRNDDGVRDEHVHARNEAELEAHEPRSVPAHAESHRY